MQHSSSTTPGGTVTYSIWVWSTVPASGVTASATASTRTLRAPQFTLCPTPHGSRCSLGMLPANQAFGLMVTDHVRSTATAGAPITLAVTVSATALSPAQAAITTSVAQVGQTPPAGSVPSLPPVPPVTLAPIPGQTITPPGLTGLFPTVTPQATPNHRSGQARRLAGVTQTSSALPLDPRLIGGQLAALAVLAAAVTMVVARLSLRTPQASGAGRAAPPAGGDGTQAGDGAGS